MKEKIAVVILIPLTYYISVKFRPKCYLCVITGPEQSHCSSVNELTYRNSGFIVRDTLSAAKTV